MIDDWWLMINDKYDDDGGDDHDNDDNDNADVMMM